MTGFLYLFSILDKISNYLDAISVIALIGSIILFIIAGMISIDDGEYKKILKVACISLSVSIISGFLNVLVPSKTDAMIIYALPKIADNKQVKELSPKLIQSINDTIDGYDQYIKRKLNNKKEDKK